MLLLLTNQPKVNLSCHRAFSGNRISALTIEMGTTAATAAREIAAVRLNTVSKVLMAVRESGGPSWRINVPSSRNLKRLRAVRGHLQMFHRKGV